MARIDKVSPTKYQELLATYGEDLESLLGRGI